MKPMSEITAFVTGGTGFVGSNLVAGLNDLGIKPRLLHRQSSSLEALKGLEYDTVLGDILDEPSTLSAKLEGVDWLFHAAGISDYWRNGIESLYKVNVDGTRNMLEASRLADVGRFIFTSSLGSFGIPEDGQPINENCTFNLRPDQLPYGYSKHLAELAVLEAFASGLEVVILNPCFILGPRDFKKISGSIVTEAARGILRFNLPGALSFVAVEDVVEGHIAAAQKGESGQKYILSGPNLTIKEANRNRK
jgi:dihydroflavonol-4-reductase